MQGAGTIVHKDCLTKNNQFHPSSPIIRKNNQNTLNSNSNQNSPLIKNRRNPPKSTTNWANNKNIKTKYSRKWSELSNWSRNKRKARSQSSRRSKCTRWSCCRSRTYGSGWSRLEIILSIRWRTEWLRTAKGISMSITKLVEIESECGRSRTDDIVLNIHKYIYTYMLNWYIIII